MTITGVTDPYGALALAVFVGAVPIAAGGFLLRALRNFRRI